MKKTQVIQEDIMSMQKDIENQMQKIEQEEDRLLEEKRTMEKIVSEHSEKRIKLVKQKLMEQKMTWCTRCSKIIPQKATRLVLIEGKERYSHGYQGSLYGFRSFSKIHRACHACRKGFTEKHGISGDYDSQAKNQTSFFAFRVTKHKDGYYAHKFGDWVKLNDKNYPIDEPSDILIEKLAKEYDIPPKIKYET
ncbi:MAG: hypothetical protein A2271_03305 [Candidatus Moranbacteria bacterium RIFOXYA12_FULL_35_19]|nr:MAG: hypothetical protein UR78_C0019G0002 [Candidatus Moranbacteria bacterium GW2011_GWF2_35_39]OGI30719.1 MAG: hypothetical protein A2343_03025 [Candidatus Moranbacteria bacterium RIFOXYB12_FULL_35_8]OGI33404.1 MAG: hypothetical protein A2489_03435 [Candidatus Moranbacteria bacterium RIFOXYC12_FULL_36_13]OGI36339.1 MAG: hypothetical protein A2271_03305 [Candidatus Moranbacteria bacterium RIFOXYA12_FULL_35_19]